MTTTPTCSVEDGVPSCATTPAGRLRWVVAELAAIVAPLLHRAKHSRSSS